MKTHTHTYILTGLLLAGTLAGGTVPVNADDTIVKDSLDFAGYCHMKFPPMRENTLSWDRPELNENAEKSIDFYGACDHDPTGIDEVKAQRGMLLRDAGDGSNE